SSAPLPAWSMSATDRLRRERAILRGASTARARYRCHPGGLRTASSRLTFATSRRARSAIRILPSRHYSSYHLPMVSYVRCTVYHRLHGRRKKKISYRPIFDAPARRRSAKLEAFYEPVEALADGPYVRLFAQDHRKGRSSFGNEI